MKIYICSTKLFDDKNMGKYISSVCEQRREKVARLKQKEDKKRSLAAGLALRIALHNESIDYDNAHFFAEANGKPYVKHMGDKKIFYNLSHSGEYAVAVVADEEVGIDIENIRSCNLKVVKRCFTKREYYYIEQKDENKRAEAFTTIWTLKESYLKATGEGIRKDLNSFETQYNEAKGSAFVCNDKKAYLKVLKKVEGYIISVCAFSEINDIEINFINSDSFDKNANL